MCGMFILYLLQEVIEKLVRFPFMWHKKECLPGGMDKEMYFVPIPLHCKSLVYKTPAAG